MPRSILTKKRLLSPDPVYKSRLVTRLVNRTMRSGKKTVAQKQVYKALEFLKEKHEQDPLIILRRAMDNIKPKMEVKSRRVGGAAYQIPIPVRGDRRESLAIRWLIKEANKRPNSQYHTFAEKLYAELWDAYNNTGAAVGKKTNIHRMAEANKAFGHFRW